MRNHIRWATMVAVAAMAVALGLSSASATTPTPPPGPPLPAAAPGHTSAGKVFNPAVYRPARTESVFTPIIPCRIADTRKGGGALANAAIRNFYVRGTTHFVGQGGTSGGCGIPSAATAIAANVTVAGAAASGYLSGYPYGSSEPKTNFVTYRAGQNITANPILPLAVGLSPDLSVRNHGALPAHVIIDVTGYYLPQIQGLISTAGTLYSGSSRILSASRTGTGTYQVVLDSDVHYCTPNVVAYYGTGQYTSAYDFNANIVSVYIWRLNATGGAVPFDPAYFYLTVTC